MVTEIIEVCREWRNIISFHQIWGRGCLIKGGLVDWWWQGGGSIWGRAREGSRVVSIHKGGWSSRGGMIGEERITIQCSLWGWTRVPEAVIDLLWGVHCWGVQNSGREPFVQALMCTWLEALSFGALSGRQGQRLWYANKCLMIGTWLENSWFVALANFHGVNKCATADLNLPMCC